MLQVFLLVDSATAPQDGEFELCLLAEGMRNSFFCRFYKVGQVVGQSTGGQCGSFFLKELANAEIEPVKDFACSAKTARGRGELLAFIGRDATLEAEEKKILECAVGLDEAMMETLLGFFI